MIKTLNGQSYMSTFVDLEGVSVTSVRVMGWGNGAVISMAGAVLDYVNYLSSEGGVVLNFENGVVIKCGECEVNYV